MAFIIMQKMYF